MGQGKTRSGSMLEYRTRKKTQERLHRESRMGRKTTGRIMPKVWHWGENSGRIVCAVHQREKKKTVLDEGWNAE